MLQTVTANVRAAPAAALCCGGPNGGRPGAGLLWGHTCYAQVSTDCSGLSVAGVLIIQWKTLPGKAVSCEEPTTRCRMYSFLGYPHNMCVCDTQ